MSSNLTSSIVSTGSLAVRVQPYRLKHYERWYSPMITKEQKYNMVCNRINKLEANNKNIKSGGVLRRLRREKRNLEKEIA